MPVKSIPDGLHSLTPSLVTKNGSAAIEFYKKAFGAEETSRFLGPDGKSIVHASVRIGNSTFFVVDEMGMGDMPGRFPARSPNNIKGVTAGLQLNVENVDAAFKRAIDAGGKEAMKPETMFWGDRFAQIVDPEGHVWNISTHVEDVSPQEMAKRSAEFFSKMGAANKK